LPLGEGGRCCNGDAGREAELARLDVPIGDAGRLPDPRREGTGVGRLRRTLESFAKTPGFARTGPPERKAPMPAPWPGLGAKLLDPGGRRPKPKPKLSRGYVGVDVPGLLSGPEAPGRGRLILCGSRYTGDSRRTAVLGDGSREPGLLPGSGLSLRLRESLTEPLRTIDDDNTGWYAVVLAGSPPLTSGEHHPVGLLSSEAEPAADPTLEE